MMTAGSKRAVVLLHGDAPAQFRLERGDVLICADGGAEHAASRGWVPEVVIGDLDSISPETERYCRDAGAKFIVFPVEKDKTDGELALQYALEQRYPEVVILGAPGGRLDHLLANIFMLAQVPDDRSVRILGGSQQLWCTTTSSRILGQAGDQVSLIPLSCQVTGVTTSGLRYPLNRGVLRFGTTLGISNLMVAEEAQVEVESGRLLIVHTPQQGVDEGK